MLDRQLFRTNPDLVRRGCARKGIDAPVDEVIRLDGERRETLATLERQQAEMNRISKSIGQLMAQGRRDEAEAAKAQTKDLKEAIAAGEQRLREIEQALREAELLIPNLPHDTVPDGLDETANVVLREWGEKPSFDFEPKPHWDLATELGLLDLPRGAKVAGSGFPCYVGMGARLQRALFQSMIEFQTRERGYTEVYPPYLVNRASMIGTGNFPKFEEDVYRADEDLWLIPTAEVPVTNLYRDEILDGDLLTLNLAAFSGCFRREAGAAGKDTRGLLRVHQFDKVELVKFCKPEDSYDELEKLTADAEAVLQALGQAVRPRGVGARSGQVPRNLQLQQLRGVPSAARQHPLPARAGRQAGVRAHPQRERRRLPEAVRRAAGDVPAGRRVGGASGVPEAVDRHRPPQPLASVHGLGRGSISPPQAACR